MRSNYEGNIRKDIMDAIREGYSTSEIPDLLGIQPQQMYNAVSALTNAGSLIRVEKGKYIIPDISTSAPSINGNGAKSHPVERIARQVQLPDYMRTRESVTLFVEHSPEEIENVMRLELCIGGNWIPMPVQADLRLCVGDDIPRWSATQEIYTGVAAYRCTFKNGAQSEYPHNPDVPLTLDRRLS